MAGDPHVATTAWVAKTGFHAMHMIAFVLVLFLSSTATAQQQLRYNPYSGQYQYAPGAAMPRYNPYTQQRDLAGPGATLQYNPYTKQREYAPPGAMPRYNPYTKSRQLTGPNW
jgi:hypothetical protein